MGGQDGLLKPKYLEAFRKFVHELGDHDDPDNLLRAVLEWAPGFFLCEKAWFAHAGRTADSPSTGHYLVTSGENGAPNIQSPSIVDETVTHLVNRALETDTSVTSVSCDGGQWLLVKFLPHLGDAWVLGMQRSDEAGWSEEDFLIMEDISALMARRLSSLLLQGALRRNFETVLDLLSRVTAEYELLKGGLEALRSLIGVRCAAVEIHNDKGELINSVFTGECDRDAEVVEKGLARSVIGGEGEFRPHMIPDEPCELLCQQCRKEKKPLLIAPVPRLGQLFGCLCLCDKLGKGRFSREDRLLVENFAGSVTLMLDSLQKQAENRQMQEVLRQREERLFKIIESEPECVKLMAEDGSLLDMNPAGLEMIEADARQQVLGESVYQLIVERDRDAFIELNRKIFEGESGTLEFEVQGLKGGRRWLETHATPLRNSGGKIVAQLAVTRDITERRQVTRALRILAEIGPYSSNKGFIKDLVRNLSEIYRTRYAFAGLFADETKSSIRTLAVWAGDGFADNFVYELAGTPCEDVLNGDQELVEKAVQQRYPHDRLLVDMEVQSYFGTIVRDSAGLEPVGILVVMDTQPMPPTDVTGSMLHTFATRMAAELARTRADEELKLAASVFETSLEGMLITDPNGTILRTNPAFTRISGYLPEEAVGANPRLLQSGCHGPEFYQRMWTTIAAEGRWQGEIWNRRKSGEIYPEWLCITVVKDAKSELTHYIGIFSDITERKLSEERIRRLSNFDPLTGLPNRGLCKDRLEQALEQAEREGEWVALIHIDLDRFKPINDSLGQQTGDALLQEISRRLQAAARATDTIARLGGDEFAAILPGFGNTEQAVFGSNHVANKILNKVLQPIELSGQEIVITASLGIVLYPKDGATGNELQRKADRAVSHAKSAGRNRFKFYSGEMDARVKERLVLESQLRRALEREEFALHYQAQVDASGRIRGVEALIRWYRPDGLLIPPMTLIPLAEEIGLIDAIGDWVLWTACDQLKRWQQAGIGELSMAVNISPHQFHQIELSDRVFRVLDEMGVSPGHIELEITESSLMGYHHVIAANLERLNEMGVAVVLDDFGTGYSSLSYLKRFRLSALKIDRSFVEGVPGQPDETAITLAVISMARSLGLQVVAEGVETRCQAAFLNEHHCDRFQGYLFSKPVAADRITAWLEKGIKLGS